MIFAGRLRAERMARGMSKRALALRAGLSPAYVTLLEQGRRAPTRAAVEALGAALAAFAHPDQAPAEGTTALLLAAAGYGSTGANPASRAAAALSALLGDPVLAPELRGELDGVVADVLRQLHARLRHGAPASAGARQLRRLLAGVLPVAGPEEEVRRVLDEVRSPVYDL